MNEQATSCLTALDVNVILRRDAGRETVMKEIWKAVTSSRATHEEMHPAQPAHWCVSLHCSARQFALFLLSLHSFKIQNPNVSFLPWCIHSCLKRGALILEVFPISMWKGCKVSYSYAVGSCIVFKNFKCYVFCWYKSKFEINVLKHAHGTRAAPQMDFGATDEILTKLL